MVHVVSEFRLIISVDSHVWIQFLNLPCMTYPQEIAELFGSVRGSDKAGFVGQTVQRTTSTSSTCSETRENINRDI